MVIPSWNCVFSRVQAAEGVSNMFSRVGTMLFHASRAPKWVSNMVVPSWHHVFSRAPNLHGRRAPLGRLFEVARAPQVSPEGVLRAPKELQDGPRGSRDRPRHHHRPSAAMAAVRQH